MKHWSLLLLAGALAACSSAPKKSAPPAAAHAGNPAAASVASRPASGDCSRYAAAQEDPSTRGDYTRGGLYKPGVSDSTPDHVPNLDCIVEPEVIALPRSTIGNKSPYSVLGKQYEVLDKPEGYVERGTASYYGQKFHGRLTSNREVYDMYAFSAAHKTLPLPSFARVTNLDNGESVVVRVNDRGPFHEGRVIDLSYAAAVKLGITQRGTGRVEVRALTADGKDAQRLAKAPAAPPAPQPTTPAKPAASAMDRLVTGLPANAANAPAVASARTPTLASATPATTTTTATTGESPGRRYYARSKPVTVSGADDFDAWLRSQNLVVAGGKIVPAGQPGMEKPGIGNGESGMGKADASPVATVPAATAPVVATAGAAPASASAHSRFPIPDSRPSAPVMLQVGSYASRDNADRALARLTAAGIASANLSDINSDGRTLWRLRVGAADAITAEELSRRIASLGFGQPRQVRE
ncbi:MAG: septal ring lytic transglycosylase RlpA family protein [Pseudoxanthomonas sp.]